jgi:hypothetical protein
LAWLLVCWAGPRGHGAEESWPEPIHASAGRQLPQQAVGPSGYQGDGKRFSFFSSFFSLFIYLPNYSKYKFSSQNKIK